MRIQKTPPTPLVEVRGERDSGKRDLPYVLFEVGWWRLRVKYTNLQDFSPLVDVSFMSILREKTSCPPFFLHLLDL